MCTYDTDIKSVADKIVREIYLEVGTFIKFLVETLF